MIRSSTIRSIAGIEMEVKWTITSFCSFVRSAQMKIFINPVDWFQLPPLLFRGFFLMIVGQNVDYLFCLTSDFEQIFHFVFLNIHPPPPSLAKLFSDICHNSIFFRGLRPQSPKCLFPPIYNPFKNIFLEQILIRLSVENPLVKFGNVLLK